MPSTGGPGGGGVRIEVDPEVLIRAGQRLGDIGTQLGMLSDAATPILSSGIASGMDPAGLNFGLEYSDTARQLAPALAAAANAGKALGVMLEASGYNYRNADAASTIGGAGRAGGVSGEPSETIGASVPSGPNGIFVPPPGKWALVYPFVQMFGGMGLTWPSGHPSLLKLLATQWENIATGLDAFDGDVAALQAAVSGQHIPEGGTVQEKLGTFDTWLSELAANTRTLATSIKDFADGAENTQDAIRRLLDRVSFDGLIDTVTGFLTGEGDDILRDVGRDIGQLLENLQNQVKGVVGLLGQLAELIGDAVTALQDLVRPFLVATFGDDVGNALATTFDTYTDFQVGLVTGLINLVAGTVALADADTWKGIAETARQVAEDPTKLDDVLLNMGKEFIAYDKITGDNPARGIGEAAFNVGSLFVPGGALSKGGTVAASLRYTSRLLEEGRLPRLGDLPGFGRSTPGPNDPTGAGRGLPDNPNLGPGPVPDSVIGPLPPNGIDAPTTPHGLGGQAGPPDPPGPTGTPGGGDSGPGSGGGDGPPPGPPEPPGRAAGPPESAPGRVDGQPTSPTSPGPGSVDSQRISEPSASISESSPGDSATSASQHAPESSSPTGSHETSHAQSEPGISPTHQTPPIPDTLDNGSPTENHRSGASEYSGRPDDGPHTPASQQPAHTPVAEQPGSPDPPKTDGSPTREQTQTSGIATTPMAGMPFAPHASAGVHGPAGSPDPAGRAPSSEATPRSTPDARVAQTPESTRTHAPTATGPSTGSSPSMPMDPGTRNGPSAPVNPAAAQSLSGFAGESTRIAPEPPAPRHGDGARESPPPPPQAGLYESRSPAGPDRPGTHPDQGASDPNTGAGSTSGQSPNHHGPPGNPADARVYGPHELRSVEDPAHQTAVEQALRDADGNALVHADPRTNDYGHLVNDGGPTVPGRSNNCLDCSLSALSSFLGDPTVSAPRHLDRLPDNTIDRQSGEQSGLRRAEDWLGGGMLEFHGRSLTEQFDALHQYVNDLGHGSAALVVNGWHAVDPTSSHFLYHGDGSPVTDGSHATVVVYPEGASSPVWWDPQTGLTSDHPPPLMTGRSTFLHLTPIEPNQGAHHGGVENQGTGAGVSGGDVADPDVSSAPVPPRVGVHEGLEPGADRLGGRTGDGSAGDRFGDGNRVRVPELVDADGGGGVHGVQADGREPSGPADLPVPVVDHSAADPGGRSDDRVPADGGVADRPSGADTTASAQDREAHIPIGSDRLAVDRGDVARGGGEPSEPGHLAGDGNDPGVVGGDPQLDSLATPTGESLATPMGPAAEHDHPSGPDDHPSDPGEAPPDNEEVETPDQLSAPEGQPAVEVPRFDLDYPLDYMSPELRTLSEQNLTGSGETVLGPFKPAFGGPSYIEVADARSASYFSLGDRWNDFEPIERLAANQHVLDIAAANRDVVTYSVDFDDIKQGSYAEAELQYLEEKHGYRRSGDRTLLPPP